MSDLWNNVPLLYLPKVLPMLKAKETTTRVGGTAASASIIHLTEHWYNDRDFMKEQMGVEGKTA